MNIRHRITLLGVLTFTAIVLIGGFSVIQSRNSASEVRSVTETVVPSALASADLVSQLKQVQLETVAVINAPNDKLAAQAKEKLSVRKGSLLEAINQQASSSENHAQRGLALQAKESLENYFNVVDETVRYKLSGRSEMAHASYFGNVAQYQWELEQIVETIRVEKNRSKDSAIATLNENMMTTVSTIAVVTVVALILMAIIGVMLYRQITGPLSRMQVMMSEIASNQDFTRRVPVDKMDEIGHSIVAFNGMIEKIEESSVQLKQKTADIQTMLQNIPQGILMVEQGNKIHHEYSAYLETLLEAKNVAGRSLMEVLFSNTNLGADILSQVEAVTGACIGEDVMNFEFNQHLMVGEVEKRMSDGRVKILDLSWSPITDENNMTVRLMLCVRDVTELRKLAAEANEQKRELEMIGEILSVTQEKFHEFIVGSLKMIDENELIIRENIEADMSAIAKLFRNMHTVKGNGRTYGLQYLTNIVHGAEQSYDELCKPHPNLVWDQQMLMSELTLVREALERYARINEVSLGRKGPGRRGNVERFLMVDKKHILESLNRLESVNTANVHELIAVRNAVRKTLRQLGTERIGETLASVLDSAPTLAKELGKAEPVIHIEENGYVIHNQASGMLKNVFMHLIRNSIDHGIETPDVREANGKAAAGTIQLRMGVKSGMLQIALSDDGRGLAMSAIRKIATARGLMGGANMSDDEVARLIFLPGFSTAEKVTEVSGRGVGMDAVQEFVKREGGKIEIRFGDSSAGADFRQFSVIVSLPDSFAVEIGGGDQVFADDSQTPVSEQAAFQGQIPETLGAGGERPRAA